MQIHKESHDGNQIKSYEPGLIVVNDTRITANILLTPEIILQDLDLSSLPNFSEDVLLKIIELKPDMVLFGCGDCQQRIPAHICGRLAEQGIGTETMTTIAACHTYTVLANEYRRVLAILKI